MKSRFKVYHKNFPIIGQAEMNGNTVRFKADPASYEWLEQQGEDWLRSLQSNVRKLVRSVGHTGKFYATEDMESGLIVERI